MHHRPAATSLAFSVAAAAPPRTHGSISAAVVPKQLDSRLSDHLQRPLLRTRSACGIYTGLDSRLTTARDRLRRSLLRTRSA
ncbi:hypothetical protein PR001_g25551 [Phytophthora rubi]|uniref:Uncharacterized protein n=1 Tax=Phytophthora rubi TaxID=129364 RepID=A0A6A3I6U6_9STRA|nr:hypothetical protein PR001_g25551 [Phytophthora rubi]